MVIGRAKVGNLPKPASYTKADYMRLLDRLDGQDATLSDHGKRLTDVEKYCADNQEMMGDIAEIKKAIFKLVKYAKFAAPSIISAAIAAGIVNGKIGAFLNALVTGSQ